MNSSINRELAPILLFFMVLAIFYSSFSSSLTWHDRQLMAEVKGWPSGAAVDSLVSVTISPEREKTQQFRPVPRITLFLDQFLWGDDARWRRAENLLFHYLTVLIFYLVVLRAFGDIRTSLFSSMLFALHPLAVEPVNSVMARDGTLSALFLLSAFLAMQKAEKGKSAWGFYSVCFFALSVLSLEAALMGGLFLLVVFFLQRGKVPLRIRISAVLTLLLAGAAYYSLRVYLHGDMTSGEFMRPAFWDSENMGYSLSAFYDYLYMMAMPFSLNVGYVIHPVDLSSFQAIVALSALALFVILAILPWSAGPLRFSCVWIVVFSLPFMGSLPYASLHLSDRFVYLALPGFCLLAGWLISSLLVRNRYFGSLVLAVALVILASQTHSQNVVWTNDFTLWDNAVKESPSSAYASFNMGRIHDEIDARSKAITYYEKSIEADPGYFAPHFGLGNVYRRTERHGKAIVHYSYALLQAPEKKWINLFLGDTFTDMEQWDRAIYSYRRYLEDNLRDPTAHHKIAVALQGKGDYKGAFDHYTEATSSWPGYAKAHYDFSQLLLNNNDRGNAMHELKLALLIEPEYSEARMLLNMLESEAGKAR